MKNILKLLNIIILGAFLLVSCNKNDYPEFDDKNAFVAFDQASYSINEGEDGAQLEVSITLASVAGISNTVICELVDGTAKKGTNFNVVGDGSLTFTKEARTQILKIDIINITEDTGDLNFGIKFSNTGSVTKGEADTCVVKITDYYPLSFLFGDYTGSGHDFWQGVTTWNVSMSKDADDQNVVWIDNLAYPSDVGNGYLVYGTVNAEKTKITIPFNQMIPSSNLAFWGLTSTGEPHIFVKSGSIVLDIKDGGKTIGFPTDMGIAVANSTTGDASGLILKGNISLTKE